MQKPYSLENARNDLEVINWLLSAGAISTEDARYIANYVRECAQEPPRGSRHMRNYVQSLKA